MKKITFEKMSFQVLLYYYIITVLGFGSIFAIIALVFREGTEFYYIINWIVGATMIFACFLYLPLYYLNYGYCITQGAVIIKRGVIFHRIHYMPRNKITYATVYKTFLSKILNSCTVVAIAPGKRIVLTSVKLSKAEYIFKQLSDKSFEELDFYGEEK